MAILDTAAQTFAGITNENEFFGHHYLAEVFRGDIRNQLDAWLAREEATKGVDGVGRDGGSPSRPEIIRAPQKVLAGLGGRWFVGRKALADARDEDAFREAFLDLQRPLLAALGYTVAPDVATLVDGHPFRVWCRAGQHPASHAASRVLVIPAAAYRHLEDDLLDQPIDVSLYPGAAPEHARDATWADWLSDAVFGADEGAPRFVLLLGADDWLLLDRLKWPNNRALRLSWGEILDRRDTPTIEATAALLHRESLAPDEGTPLLDGLDENAHKHAFGVSEDLKYALREAIELLGNEAARQLRAQAEAKKLSVFAGRAELDAEQLSLECLRLMYRLLFVFYIEARPELGYVPIRSEMYLKGYSLEALRDLELVQLDTPRARDGLFFDDSLRRLFRLIHEGSGAALQQSLRDAAEGAKPTVTLAPLDSRLFDPEATPLLNLVRFPNQVWQRVIALLSLTSGKGRGRRGRVSYQLLSINQLGAVYEALLSFRGFFAKEDLFEVQPAAKKTAAAASSDQDDEVEGDEDGDEDDADAGESEGAGRRGNRSTQGGAAGVRRRDDLEVGWFVPEARLADYAEDERVYELDEHGHRRLRRHAKGSFIYRLAGRDREKSASYYTPQVLTACLVKYALKELLRLDDTDPAKRLKADDILSLTVVEPAMGSAAFLNEAVNQLAEKYLELKQAELGTRIPHEAYPRELQKVRMYLADRNVFGVDLNPVAVELAEVSLWLNAIYGDAPDEQGHPRPARVPWFGYQLFDGNSLIGARAEVYAATSIAKGAKPAWHEQAPRRLDPQAPDRRADEVYHFLLPDPGMASYTDKVAKGLYADDFARLKVWRKTFCAPLQSYEIARLQQLSAKVDDLWAAHAAQLQGDRRATEDHLSVWPAEGHNDTITSRASKEAIRRQGLLNEDGDEATPYRRLKLVMDYWCALWFWPIRASHRLPSRDEWWMEVGAILEGNIVDVSPDLPLPFGYDRPGVPLVTANAPRLPEFEEQPALAVQDVSPQLHDRLGRLRITRLREAFKRIGEVEALAKARRFLHWELAFADVFHTRGGFDLVLGNPPWIKVEWNEAGVLGEANPLLALRKTSASELTRLRADTFATFPALQGEWTIELEQAEGTQEFLNATQNFPLLRGVQTNLYKCFLPLTWRVSATTGVSGLVHPEGVYDDPKGGVLREPLYRRLRSHFQFQNELSLFGISHTRRYGLNLFGPDRATGFDLISNLFHPRTIDESYAHPGRGHVPGYKSQGEWELAGHRDRIVRVSDNELAVFASLYDEPGTPSSRARLPSLHAGAMASVLRKLARYPTRLSALGDDYSLTWMWDETRQQADGTISRRKGEWFPATPSELIISGPHIFVCNPFYKCPRRVCTANGHYDAVELKALPDAYLPRGNFRPMVDRDEYKRRIPRVPWLNDDGHRTPVTGDYRLAARKRLAQSGERTLVCALVPPNVAHVISCVSASFRSREALLATSAAASSIVLDFFVKSAGWADLTASGTKLFPLLPYSMDLGTRVLALNCLTRDYARLWGSAIGAAARSQSWSQPNNPRLPQNFFAELTSEWTPACALRNDYARRLALVELDVLVARALGLTLDELQLIYRVQFAIVAQNESDTWYDMHGSVAFTANRGLPGVGLPRRGGPGNPATRITYVDGRTVSGNAGWEDVCEVPEGTVIEQEVLDDTLPNGPHKKTRRWVAPFALANREDDYRIAWEYFQSRSAVDAAGNEALRHG